MARVVLQIMAVVEDIASTNPPTLMNFKVIGTKGENFPVIQQDKEFALRKGGSATHYVILMGVTKVKVVSIKYPFDLPRFRYNEMIEVEVVGFKKGVTELPRGIPSTFWVSPEDLEEIPPVAQNNLPKPGDPPAESEEVSENGEHPPGWGMGV